MFLPEEVGTEQISMHLSSFIITSALLAAFDFSSTVSMHSRNFSVNGVGHTGGVKESIDRVNSCGKLRSMRSAGIQALYKVS